MSLRKYVVLFLYGFCSFCLFSSLSTILRPMFSVLVWLISPLCIFFKWGERLIHTEFSNTLKYQSSSQQVNSWMLFCLGIGHLVFLPFISVVYKFFYIMAFSATEKKSNGNMIFCLKFVRFLFILKIQKFYENIPKYMFFSSISSHQSQSHKIQWALSIYRIRSSFNSVKFFYFCFPDASHFRLWKPHYGYVKSPGYILWSVCLPFSYHFSYALCFALIFQGLQPKPSGDCPHLYSSTEFAWNPSYTGSTAIMFCFSAAACVCVPSSVFILLSGSYSSTAALSLACILTALPELFVAAEPSLYEALTFLCSPKETQVCLRYHKRLQKDLLPLSDLWDSKPTVSYWGTWRKPLCFSYILPGLQARKIQLTKIPLSLGLTGVLKALKWG